MTLTTDKNGTQLTVHLSGELNTMTAPELTALLDKIISGYEAIFQVCSPLRGFHFPFAAFAKGRKRLYF